MSKPARFSNRVKGRGKANQEEPGPPSHLASSDSTPLEANKPASGKATQSSKKKNDNTKPTKVSGSTIPADPMKQQETSFVSQGVKRSQSIPLKREEHSPAPASAIAGEGPPWFDYRDLPASVVSPMRQTRPEDMSQAQLDYLFKLSQHSPSAPPPHFYPQPPGLSSNINPLTTPSALEGNLEEKHQELMASHRKAAGRQTSFATLGGEVRDLRLSGNRVATTIAATQKRKRLGSQPQREPPQVPKAEPTLKEAPNPLDCEMAKERARKGQFAVHSELSAGGILRSQLTSCKELLEDLGKILGKLPVARQDPHAKDIQEDIKKFLSCGIDGGGIVGFLGEAGVGKSTLLNALLDMEDFLPIEEYGKFMPIVLEFAKSRPGLGPFTMDVKYVTKAQLEEDAEILFREIYVEGTKLQRPNTREAKSIQRRLNHLFPDASWSSVSDAHEDISKLFAEDESLQREDGIIHAMDQRACIEQLRDLTVSFSNDRPTEPERWPLIDRIRVYLDSEILNTGVIIADVPGIDKDGTRVKAMQQYLSGVQDIIIVTKLEYIFVDDVEALKKIGYEGVTLLDGRSRGVLVTNHLDEYTTAKAKALFKKNVPFKASIEQAEKDLLHIQGQISGGNRGERKSKSEIISLAQKHEKTLEQICSSILDDFIEPQATVTFGSTIPTDDITWQVFRVDPIAYTKTKKDGTFLAHLYDNMNIQQIVELQDYIGALTYPRQFRLAVSRFKHAQSIIANLIFWCSSEIKLPQAIRSSLEKSLLQEVSDLEEQMDVVKFEIAETISESLAGVYAHTEIAVYEATEKAQKRIMNTTANLNTMKAVCRGGGEIGDTNWNSYILEEVRDKMCDAWKGTITFTVQMMNTFQARYFETIESIESRFEEFINDQNVDNTMKAAFKTLISKELQNSRSHMVEICRDNVRVIHNMFSEQIESENIFDQLGEIIMADIKAIEDYVYKSMKECHAEVIGQLNRKLSHIVSERPNAAKSRKDPKYKQDLLQKILTNAYPEVEKIINTIGSLSPGNIVDMREAMINYAFPIVESVD
ncbi:hypothetical protein TWF679_000398 [Orbilia oligospora]|uniref:Uncharacterized protein n=1 Tax=Orbilia oligospora TaxID=2813651 RepID=A0A8H8VI53_ORBOL|nr:hypothetical protein TWF679_000398 [Orbilia oligospora]